MTNEEIIKKINDTLKQVHKHFDNADGFWQDKFNKNAPEKYKQDRHGLRNWLLDMYRQQSGNKNVNMFYVYKYIHMYVYKTVYMVFHIANLAEFWFLSAY